MFGFFMALATTVKSFKDKVDAKSVAYEKKKRELKRHIATMNGQDEAPLASDDEDVKVGSTKEKLKTKILGVLSAVVLFFELLPLFSSVMIWALLVFCFLVVVVVIFVFLAMIQAFLRDQKNFEPEAMCGKPSSGQVQDSAGGILAWTDAELASKGAKLTENEKNMYKLGILAHKSILGYDGKPALKVKELSTSKKVAFILGLSSTETSMRIYGSSGGDVFKDNSTIAPNSAGNGYGFMGIDSTKSLSDYYSNSSIEKITAAYKPSSTPAYPAAFPPYAVAMSTAHHQGNIGGVISRNSDKITAYADKNKIKKNRTEFIGMVKMLLAQAHYHGAVNTDYDGLIGFYGAFYLASGDSDDTRSFDNWSLEDTKITDYSESGLREMYLGTGGKNAMHLVSTPDKLKRGGTTRIVLNGKIIDDTLWGYLWKKESGNKGMKDAWDLTRYYSAISKQGKGDRPINFYYGINSYLQSKRIEKNLSKKMGIVGDTGSSSSDESSDTSSDTSSDESSSDTTSDSSSGGSSDCPPAKEEDDSSPTVQVGNFKETKGKGQSIVNGKPFDEWVKGAVSSGKIPSSYYSKMKPTIGTSSQLAGTHTRAVQAKYQDKVFGVPHYGQDWSYKETYGNLNWHYAVIDTFNVSGCMVYAHAYAASALTGRMINPAEMGLILTANGGLVSDGMSSSSVAGTYKSLGLKSVYFGSGASSLTSASSAKAGTGNIPSVLKKGGVVVIRVGNGKLTKLPNHFFSLTAVETKNGVDYYSNYNSVDVGMSMRKLTRNDLMAGRLHREAVGVYK